MTTDDHTHHGDTVHGDKVAGDKVGGDKVLGDKLTVIYQWAREQPADPQVVAAAQGLFTQIPTNHIPALAALAEGSRMPFSRNPLFVGREPDLMAIAAALTEGQTAAIVQTASVTGLGGIGKTNLATEFVHRYGQFFAGGVFWLSFANAANIEVEIAECGGAGALQVRPDFHTLELKDQVAAVYREWQRDIPRLLVFDNCDSEDADELVERYRPTTGGCRVLITSRRATWDDTLGVHALPLGVLKRDESIALLQKFQPDLSTTDADTLAEELGDLPLALHLAGSYLKKYARVITFAEYLAELRKKTVGANLTSPPPAPPSAPPDPPGTPCADAAPDAA